MVAAQPAIQISKNQSEVPVSSNYSYYIDSSDNPSTTAVTQQYFKEASGNIPVYNVGANHVWLKFTVENKSDNQNLFLDVRYTNLSILNLYSEENGNLVKLDTKGNALPPTCKDCIVPNFAFNLDIPLNTAKNYLVEIKSTHPIIFPAYVCTKPKLDSAAFLQLIIVAMYAGLVCSMLLYNFFLYITVKDSSYLIYVIYTFSLLLAQFTLGGYLYKYVWPNAVFLNSYAVVFTSNFTVIMANLFAINFLHIKEYTPRIYWLFVAIIVVAVIDVMLNLLHYDNLSYTILNYNTLLSGLAILVTSIKIARHGYKPAYLYVIAWSSVLIAIILLAFRNLGVLPYNNLTASVVYIGSAIETTLLSIALADKINLFRKEKEISQAESLRVSKENAQLIQEQNVVLEQKITERTYDLEKTLTELKDAQIQLVESEKMASLGQLTAGIAHEINNPINFVKSNVKPLLLDVKDLFELINRYQKLHTLPAGSEAPALKEIKSFERQLDPDFIKDEIENLISGIEEGAERTAEIVRSLRNFSRLDESEVKTINVHEGIDSTLVLLKNMIPQYIKVVKNFEATREVECYPSKLNQVFMNILTNSVQAIKAKVDKGEETIVITTKDVDGQLQISLKDSGIGMSDEVKHKVYDPFFTTKDVGEGTGLGMSITFKIIEKHQGKIHIISSPGNGAEFILELPYAQ